MLLPFILNQRANGAECIPAHAIKTIETTHAVSPPKTLTPQLFEQSETQN